MFRVNPHRFGVIRVLARALAAAGLLVIGLVTGPAASVWAGSSGTWSTTGSLNIARSQHTGTLLPNGEVLVAGGIDATGNRLTSAELYNPATGKWSITGSMATARSGHSATLLPNGEVLVAGGIVNVSTAGVASYTATAELYNPATGQWTATGSMTAPRYFHGAALLQNGQVLAAGGFNANGTLASAELYNPSTGTWTATGSMNDARAVPATLLQSGQVLMAGGNGLTAELYSNEHWTLTSSMKFNHPSAKAALLANDNVLVFGGHLASYAGEFYNPSTGTWTATHNIAVNPPNGPLTALNSGQVLLSGGESGYGTDSLCRLYDPPTNSWLATGSMNQARTSHTATLLQNGQVLAVGGIVKNSNNTFTTLGSAELYTP